MSSERARARCGVGGRHSARRARVEEAARGRRTRQRGAGGTHSPTGGVTGALSHRPCEGSQAPVLFLAIEFTASPTRNAFLQQNACRVLRARSGQLYLDSTILRLCTSRALAPSRAVEDFEGGEFFGRVARAPKAASEGGEGCTGSKGAEGADCRGWRGWRGSRVLAWVGVEDGMGGLRQVARITALA